MIITINGYRINYKIFIKCKNTGSISIGGGTMSRLDATKIDNHSPAHWSCNASFNFTILLCAHESHACKWILCDSLFFSEARCV